MRDPGGWSAALPSGRVDRRCCRLQSSSAALPPGMIDRRCCRLTGSAASSRNRVGGILGEHFEWSRGVVLKDPRGSFWILPGGRLQ